MKTIKVSVIPNSNLTFFYIFILIYPHIVEIYSDDILRGSGIYYVVLYTSKKIHFVIKKTMKR